MSCVVYPKVSKERLKDLAAAKQVLLGGCRRVHTPYRVTREVVLAFFT
jgi:hypothetical protein